MADLSLYGNFLAHARAAESLEYRRNNAEMRMEEAFDIPDSEFVGLYRLTKSGCHNIIHEIAPFLPSLNCGGISATSKVLSALNFYASGSYQRFVGVSAHNKMHQVSVSNSIKAVTLALNNNYFRDKYIHFPQTREERNVIIQGFYQKFGMPGVLGCVDGTHISIIRPGEHEERFFNRKRYHSLNAQIVCDSNMNILSVDASHGGADHDSFIWNNHTLKRHLERLNAENEKVWFLGDSGYPLRPTLLTPFIETEPDSPQRHYTELHSRVRNTVERCIGVLKSRWRCLLVDRKLHYHPTTAGLITNACVVLHNVAVTAGMPEIALTPDDEQNEAGMQIIYPAEDNTLAAGQLVRNRLINRLWNSRQ